MAQHNTYEQIIDWEGFPPVNEQKVVFSNSTTNQLAENSGGVNTPSHYHNLVKRLQFLCNQRTIHLDEMQLLATGEVNASNLQANVYEMNAVRDKFFRLQEQIDNLECSDPTNMIIDVFRDSAAAQCTRAYKQFMSQTSRASSSIEPKANPTPVRMPHVAVPTYAGDVTEWSNFKAYFDHLIHNNNEITDIHRLHYLKTALVGPAAEVIKGVPLSESGYRTAYKLITEQYGNSQRAAAAHYQALDGPKLSSQPKANELYELVNSHTSAMAGLQEQKIPDLTDYLAMQVTLSRLDTQTRAEYESSLAPASFPSSETFRAFINAKARVIETVGRSRLGPDRRPPARQPSRSLHVAEENPAEAAVNTIRARPARYRQMAPSAPRVHGKNTGASCHYCQSQSHFLHACPDFNDLNLKQKFDFIAENLLCLNCFSKHLVHDCTSTQGCKRCGRRTHHTLLHEMYKLSVSHIPANVPSDGRTNTTSD